MNGNHTINFDEAVKLWCYYSVQMKNRLLNEWELEQFNTAAKLLLIEGMLLSEKIEQNIPR